MASRKFFKDRPALTWGVGIVAASVLILGVSTGSRLKGTPQAWSYARRYPELKAKAEALGLVVEPVRYVPPHGEGPNGADLIWEAASKWHSSDGKKKAQLELSKNLAKAAACDWIDTGNYGAAWTPPEYVFPYFYVEHDKNIQRHIKDGDIETALKDIATAFRFGGHQKGGSDGRWLADRTGWQAVALHRSLQLAWIKRDDPTILSRIENMIRSNPFKVDLEKEIAAMPASSMVGLDVFGDYRSRTGIYQQCTNVFETPDPCMMGKIDWESYRKATAARACEVWIEECRNLDDPFKTAENCWKVDVASAKSGEQDAFREGCKVFHPSIYVYVGRVADIVIKEKMADYHLKALHIYLRLGKWPDAGDMPLPTDPWTNEPLRFVREGDTASLWSVGVDRVDNKGADFVFDKGEAVMEMDVRLDFPIRPGRVIQSKTDDRPSMVVEPNDRIVR